MLLPCLAVLMLAVHRPLAAQQDPPAAPRNADSSQFKDPATARVIGIIPGAGHMYAGEPGRGVAYLGGVVGLTLAGAAMFLSDCASDIYRITSDGCESSSAGNGFLVVALGVWAWSIYDAGSAAHRENAKHGFRAALILAPEHSRGVAGGGQGVKVGLSIATR
jgi:hypothetical protein